MPTGFTIIITKKENNNFDKNQKRISYTTHAKSYDFLYSTHSKFADDKLFGESPQYIYGLDGAIHNLQKLKNNYAEASWSELFISLYEKYKDNLPAHLKGDFCGFVFEKRTARLLVFNNPAGTRRMYYHQGEELFIIAPSLKQLSDYCILRQGKRWRLHRFAAYCLLSYANVLGNHTLMQDVYRLGAGECLRYTQGLMHLHRYEDYNAVRLADKSEKQFLDEINTCFLSALEQQMAKDKEYGYTSFATLSGGLDSRMVFMLAQKMGYELQPFCFSQSSYHDEIIARQIAASMQKQLNFVPLDQANHIFDFEENLEAYDALSIYTSSAHFAWALKQLDMSKAGIIHTGMIGDGVFGGVLSAPRMQKPNIRATLITAKLFPKIENEVQAFAKNYHCEESYLLYNRMFNLSITGTYICKNYGYHASPFMDADLIKLMRSVPPKMKYFHKMYIRWINAYHPEVSQFTWERTRMKPNAHWKTLWSRYTLKAEHLYRRLAGQQQLLTMTPSEYWYRQYPKIDRFYRQLYDGKKHLVAADVELAKDLASLFEKGKVAEKALVLTLLGGIERYDIKI